VRSMAELDVASVLEHVSDLLEDNINDRLSAAGLPEINTFVVGDVAWVPETGFPALGVVGHLDVRSVGRQLEPWIQTTITVGLKWTGQGATTLNALRIIQNVEEYMRTSGVIVASGKWASQFARGRQIRPVWEEGRWQGAQVTFILVGEVVAWYA